MTDVGRVTRRDLVLRRRCVRLLPRDESIRAAFLVADQPLVTTSGLPLTHYRIVCVSDRAITLVRPSFWWNFLPRKIVFRQRRRPLTAWTDPPKGLPGTVVLDRKYYVHKRSLPELRRAVADLGVAP